jgi:hypothetical protein
MCVYNIDLVRSGRGNTGGITAKDRGKSLYKGPPKTRTRVIEIGVCGVTESIAPSFLFMCDVVVAPFVGF